MSETLATIADASITASGILNFIIALASGGAVVAIINAVAKRRTEKATAENLNVNTQTLLSELIDKSTITLRQSIDDQNDLIDRQKSRIEVLELEIKKLKREMDESIVVQRLRDAEEDNLYLRSRINTLLARIEVLTQENEKLSRG